MRPERPRVVIVGAGFGGLSAAKRLAGQAVDVVVVDRRNHHLFQPLLYQVATAALSPADIAAPVRAILSRARNVAVLLGEVVGVDTERNAVQLSGGRTLPFDWLVLATGAMHSYFGQDQWALHAPGLKSIEDALKVRRRVLLALEHAETETDPERRKALLTFVVIGGGPTGVEMAGAIAELARRSVSRDFRSITPGCSRVILVEAGNRVLPGFPETLSAKAERALRELGVEVVTGMAVTDIAYGRIALAGAWFHAHTIVWAAGVEASPAAQWLGAPHDRAGRVHVDDGLRVVGHSNIFAVGDTAHVPGPDGAPLPGIAPVAKQQGRHVADTILGFKDAPFRYRSFGNLATIGRKRAVIAWGGWELSGLAAWLAWSVAHIWFLVGFRSRIVVAVQWLWNYLTFERSARLITGADDPVSPASMPGRKAA